MLAHLQTIVDHPLVPKITDPLLAPHVIFGRPRGLVAHRVGEIILADGLGHGRARRRAYSVGHHREDSGGRVLFLCEAKIPLSSASNFSGIFDRSFATRGGLVDGFSRAPRGRFGGSSLAGLKGALLRRLRGVLALGLLLDGLLLGT